MIFSLYIFYALVQAILMTRYFFNEKDEAVSCVIAMTIFAPFASVFLIGCGFTYAIRWLVTYGR